MSWDDFDQQRLWGIDNKLYHGIAKQVWFGKSCCVWNGVRICLRPFWHGKCTVAIEFRSHVTLFLRDKTISLREYPMLSHSPRHMLHHLEVWKSVTWQIIPHLWPSTSYFDGPKLCDDSINGVFFDDSKLNTGHKISGFRAPMPIVRWFSWSSSQVWLRGANVANVQKTVQYAGHRGCISVGWCIYISHMLHVWNIYQHWP